MDISKLITLAASVVVFLVLGASGTDDADAPAVQNVRCEDRDLERTLLWDVVGSNDDLIFLHYRVRYCVPTECTKRHVQCYTDDSENERVTKVTNNSCKTRTSQLLTWSIHSFIISAVYRNKTSGTLVKFSNSTICSSITQQTTLSAPQIRTSSTKSSIKVAIELSANLRKKLESPNKADNIGLGDVMYHCNLYLSGEDYNSSSSKEGLKKSAYDKIITFYNLYPSQKYDVVCWYTIRSVNHGNSEEVKTSEKTKPDPFPQWLQITVICSLAGFIIVSILLGVCIKSIYNNFRMKDRDTYKDPPENYSSILTQLASLNAKENPERFVTPEIENEERMNLPNVTTRQTSCINTGFENHAIQPNTEGGIQRPTTDINIASKQDDEMSLLSFQKIEDAYNNTRSECAGPSEPLLPTVFS